MEVEIRNEKKRSVSLRRLIIERIKEVDQFLYSSILSLPSFLLLQDSASLLLRYFFSLFLLLLCIVVYLLRVFFPPHSVCLFLLSSFFFLLSSFFLLLSSFFFLLSSFFLLLSSFFLLPSSSTWVYFIAFLVLLLNEIKISHIKQKT